MSFLPGISQSKFFFKSKFFPVRVDTTFEGFPHTEEANEIHSCSFCIICGKMCKCTEKLKSTSLDTCVLRFVQWMIPSLNLGQFGDIA